MPVPSQRALAMQESAIRKLDRAVAERRGVRFLRVNIGQPDVPTPPAVLDALAGYRPEVLAYGPSQGLPALREAAARYHGRWNPALGPEHVAVTVGGSEAVLFAFTVTCDPGDEVLVPEPYYTNYNGFSTVAGTRIRPVRTHLSDGFALPPDEVLDAAVGPRTRAVVFSNPGNPTGAVYGRDELERLARWAARHDLFIIADEVYRRIWFDEPPTSMLELDAFADRVLVVDSFSKTFSACGLRLGFLITRNAELMARIERLAQARLGPQPLAQQGGLAALALPESYYEEVRRTYARRIAVLAEALAALPGVRSYRPRGAFYVMVGLPVASSEEFARFLVTDFQHEGESVVIAPGPGFYASPSSGTDEARIAAVLDEDRLRRAVDLLGRGLEAWRRR